MLSGDEYQHMINYSSKYNDEIFCYVINSEKIIPKPNQPNELTVSHLHSYIGWRGYLKGLGSMSDEERMAASEKGYENGIGAMSAEKRMAASKKGYENGIREMAASEGSSNDKMGIAWERKFIEFKRCVEMPEIGTPLYNWQQNQLSNTYGSCLNAKIRKEIEENEGSTVWSEWRVELSDCVEQKNRAKIGNAWERKFDEFESYDGMPERRTPLFYWQHNQLSNTHGSCLYAKIQKELAENKGSIVWSERRVKRANCAAQKRRE